MKEYLRQWPALFVVVVGAAFGLFLTLGCTETNRRCLAVSTPDGVRIAVIVGAVIGLVLAALIAWARVYAQRRKEALELRFSNSLMFSGLVDDAARSSAERFGWELALRDTLVGVVNAGGIQLWVGAGADRLLVSAAWPQIGDVDLGEPNGDITQPTQQFIDHVANYQRMSLELSSDGVRAYLQFPIYSGTWGVSQGQLGDAYDIRKLIRQINGYREVAAHGEL